MTTPELKTLEKEVLNLKVRLGRLENQVSTLTQRSKSIGQIAPDNGHPPNSRDLIAWMKLQGLIVEPSEATKRLAAEWDSLPEEEKAAHIREMDSLVLDPPLSQIIIDNRR